MNLKPAVNEADSVPVPAQLEVFVRVLGIDLAIKFLAEFGGAELYLAKRPQQRSRIAALVGIEKAAALAEAAERLPKRIPLGKRWLAQVYKARGLSTAEIARTLRASDVAVRGWLNPGSAPKPKQLTLF